MRSSFNTKVIKTYLFDYYASNNYPKVQKVNNFIDYVQEVECPNKLPIEIKLAEKLVLCSDRL